MTNICRQAVHGAAMHRQVANISRALHPANYFLATGDCVYFHSCKVIQGHRLLF